jgi:GT2 family glycosyltransferase
MTRPSVTVVIVTFNSGESIRHCLLSLWPQLEEHDEVFVVDNASTDGGHLGLVSEFPRLQLLANSRNLGFAKACNQALSTARGRYNLLLNPDARLEPDALDLAIDHLERDPKTSVLGAKVVLDGGQTDPAAHRSFKSLETYFYKALGLTRTRHPRFGRYYLADRALDRVTEVDAVVGAFLLIRRATVNEIGLLDERFFMYCEDEDWCYRVKKAGGRVIYHPGVVVRHSKGSSARQVPLRMLYHVNKSTYLFHRKNIASAYPPPVNLVVYVGLFARMTGQMAALLLRRLPLRWREGHRDGAHVGAA